MIAWIHLQGAGTDGRMDGWTNGRMDKQELESTGTTGKFRHLVEKIVFWSSISEEHKLGKIEMNE